MQSYYTDLYIASVHPVMCERSLNLVKFRGYEPRIVESRVTGRSVIFYHFVERPGRVVSKMAYTDLRYMKR